MQHYHDCPQIVRDFLTYHETIKGQSKLTISEYYLDLRMFLRFIKNPEKFVLVEKVEIYTYIQESLMLLTIVGFLIFGQM